jgi:hypothetical protein
VVEIGFYQQITYNYQNTTILKRCKMGFVVLAAFVAGWIAVARAYGKRGIKGFRRQLLGFCGGFIALVVVAIVGSRFDTSKNATASTAPAPAAAAAPQAQPEKEFVSTSAREIFAEYEANEVAADQKYKGKEVVIVGIVQSIDKDGFNNIVVHLQTPNQFMSVSATLQDKYESEAARMNKGEVLGFSCTGAGRIIGSPVLKDCRPLPLESSKKKGKKT